MGEYLTIEEDLQLNHTFAALAHPTRRAIMDQLAKEDAGLCVTDLADHYKCTLNVISKHIKILERASLILRTKKGRVHNIQLCTKPLDHAADFVQRYRVIWNEQFDRLDSHLTEMKNSEVTSIRS